MSNLSVLIQTSVIWIPCRLVDQAGVYQAAVRWSRDPAQTGTGSSLVVSVSGKMAASWSDAYNLSTGAASVFPCEENHHLSVDFTQPSCAGDDDKVSIEPLVSSFVKLKFHGSSFPRIAYPRDIFARMSLTSHEEIGVSDVHAERGSAGSSRGCHEDATRKMVSWNLSHEHQQSAVRFS